MIFAGFQCDNPVNMEHFYNVAGWLYFGWEICGSVTVTLQNLFDTTIFLTPKWSFIPCYSAVTMSEMSSERCHNIMVTLQNDVAEKFCTDPNASEYVFFT